MLKQVFQWLKNLFQILFGGNKKPAQRVTQKREPPPLTDSDLEFLFTELLEGVHQARGEVWAQKWLKNIEHRISTERWLEWMGRFGTRLLASPAPNNELASRLVQLGELYVGEISDLAYDIGMRLLTRNQPEPIWEYDEPDVVEEIVPPPPPPPPPASAPVLDNLDKVKTQPPSPQEPLPPLLLKQDEPIWDFEESETELFAEQLPPDETFAEQRTIIQPSFQIISSPPQKQDYSLWNIEESQDKPAIAGSPEEATVIQSQQKPQTNFQIITTDWHNQKESAWQSNQSETAFESRQPENFSSGEFQAMTQTQDFSIWEYDGPDAAPSATAYAPGQVDMENTNSEGEFQTITLDELFEMLQQDGNLRQMIAQQVGINTDDPEVIIQALVNQFYANQGGSDEAAY